MVSLKFTCSVLPSLLNVLQVVVEVHEIVSQLNTLTIKRLLEKLLYLFRHICQAVDTAFPTYLFLDGIHALEQQSLCEELGSVRFISGSESYLNVSRCKLLLAWLLWLKRKILCLYVESFKPSGGQPRRDNTPIGRRIKTGLSGPAELYMDLTAVLLPFYHNFRAFFSNYFE